MRILTLVLTALFTLSASLAQINTFGWNANPVFSEFMITYAAELSALCIAAILAMVLRLLLTSNKSGFLSGNPQAVNGLTVAIFLALFIGFYSTGINAFQYVALLALFAFMAINFKIFQETKSDSPEFAWGFLGIAAFIKAYISSQMGQGHVTLAMIGLALISLFQMFSKLKMFEGMGGGSGGGGGGRGSWGGSGSSRPSRRDDDVDYEVDEPGMSACDNCGALVCDDDEKCPKCGKNLMPAGWKRGKGKKEKKGAPKKEPEEEEQDEAIDEDIEDEAKKTLSIPAKKVMTPADWKEYFKKIPDAKIFKCEDILTPDNVLIFIEVIKERELQIKESLKKLLIIVEGKAKIIRDKYHKPWVEWRKDSSKPEPTWENKDDFVALLNQLMVEWRGLEGAADNFDEILHNHFFKRSGFTGGERRLTRVVERFMKQMAKSRLLADVNLLLARYGPAKLIELKREESRLIGTLLYGSGVFGERKLLKSTGEYEFLQGARQGRATHRLKFIEGTRLGYAHEGVFNRRRDVIRDSANLNTYFTTTEADPYISFTVEYSFIKFIEKHLQVLIDKEKDDLVAYNKDLIVYKNKEKVVNKEVDDERIKRLEEAKEKHELLLEDTEKTLEAIERMEE